MVNHVETTPRDREDRNANQSLLLKTQPRLQKEVALKKTTPFTEEHQGGVQPVEVVERRNVTISKMSK